MKVYHNPIKLSVIIPILNAASTLPHCLSALCQALTKEGNCELIFVDNGSTDDSIEIVKAHTEAILLRKLKPGAYAARNHGVSAASGEILIFTNPDCVVDSGWLRAVKEAFEAPTCLVALGVRRPAPDSGLNRLLGDYEIAKDHWVLTSNEPKKYYGYTNNMAVRRSAWQSHGPFSDVLLRGGDTIFVRRLVDAAGCGTVKFVPSMRISHLEVDGVVTYLKKTFTYGQSLESYSKAVPSSPLSFSDRLGVFFDASRSNSYGPIRFCALGGLLFSGIIAWWAGRFWGFSKSRLRGGA
jgi:glycosyltransferase involved in cell wall biosynthesis